MKQINFDDVKESGGSVRIPDGGYVCKIIDVLDVPEKEYLEIFFDVAEGEYKGWFGTDYFLDKPYMRHFFRSYKERALGMFKRFYKCIERSNDGFTYDGVSERSFVGKLIGLTIESEQYTGNDGNDKTRQVVTNVYDAADIRAGKFTLKAPVTTTTTDAAPMVDAYSDANVPF